FLNLRFECFTGLHSRLEDDERLDNLSTQLVRAFHGRDFEDGRVTYQTALYFKWRNPVAACFDDIVVPAFEPEIAVIVARQNVTRKIPFVPKHLGRALGFAPVPLHHSRVSVAPDRKHAILSRRNRPKVLAEKLDYSSGPGSAATAGLDRGAN